MQDSRSCAFQQSFSHCQPFLRHARYFSELSTPSLLVCCLRNDLAPSSSQAPKPWQIDSRLSGYSSALSPRSPPHCPGAMPIVPRRVAISTTPIVLCSTGAPSVTRTVLELPTTGTSGMEMRMVATASTTRTRPNLSMTILGLLVNRAASSTGALDRCCTICMAMARVVASSLTS